MPERNTHNEAGFEAVGGKALLGKLRTLDYLIVLSKYPESRNRLLKIREETVAKVAADQKLVDTVNMVMDFASKTHGKGHRKVSGHSQADILGLVAMGTLLGWNPLKTLAAGETHLFMDGELVKSLLGLLK